MPRDPGGIGKTGSKSKKARAKWKAKQEGKSSSTTTTAATAAAATDDEELEEHAEAAAAAHAVASAAAAGLPPSTEAKCVKRVRFAPLPPRVEGRFSLPRSEGWTWLGRAYGPPG